MQHRTHNLLGYFFLLHVSVELYTIYKPRKSENGQSNFICYVIPTPIIVLSHKLELPTRSLCSMRRERGKKIESAAASNTAKSEEWPTNKCEFFAARSFFGSRGRRWRWSQIIYFDSDVFHLTQESTTDNRKKGSFANAIYASLQLFITAAQILWLPNNQ